MSSILFHPYKYKTGLNGTFESELSLWPPLHLTVVVWFNVVLWHCDLLSYSILCYCGTVIYCGILCCGTVVQGLDTCARPDLRLASFASNCGSVV